MGITHEFQHMHLGEHKHSVYGKCFLVVELFCQIIYFRELQRKKYVKGEVLWNMLRIQVIPSQTPLISFPSKLGST